MPGAEAEAAELLDAFLVRADTEARNMTCKAVYTGSIPVGASDKAAQIGGFLMGEPGPSGTVSPAYLIHREGRWR